tara:strand:- start:699 stop:1226 length:528 start_codon:yes stop_codon:yes gene_type:complete
MPIKTIFLDRDGVINEEVEYLSKIKDFKFIKGVFEACAYLSSLGYKLIIITNQSGIARELLSEHDFDQISKWMINQFTKNGVTILDIFHCPHHPKSGCICRKPKPGMLLNAKEKYNVDMKNSWLIGDKENDVKAANDAGIRNTILVRSGHNIDELNSKSSFILNSIKEVNQAIKK